MTEKLDRALRALKEQERGESRHAEETLQRILRDHRAARTRRLRIALWVPVAASLVLSTAALARWGMSLPGHPLAFESVVSHGPSAPHGTATAVAAPASPLPVEAPIAPLSPPPELPSLTAPPSVVTAPVLMPHPARHAPAPLTAAASSSSFDPPPAPRVAVPNADDENLFASAHRLHFDGSSPTAALAAWDDYLARFPNGRFVPEARYNRAIDLLKLHRVDDARAALKPFADAVPGSYHRDDAQELLKKLR